MSKAVLDKETFKFYIEDGVLYCDRPEGPWRYFLGRLEVTALVSHKPRGQVLTKGERK